MKVCSEDGNELRHSECRLASVYVEVAYEYCFIGACFNLTHHAFDVALADVWVAQNHDACSFVYCQRLGKGELLVLFNVVRAQETFCVSVFIA